MEINMAYSRSSAVAEIVDSSIQRLSSARSWRRWRRIIISAKKKINWSFFDCTLEKPYRFCSILKDEHEDEVTGLEQDS